MKRNNPVPSRAEVVAGIEILAKHQAVSPEILANLRAEVVKGFLKGPTPEFAREVRSFVGETYFAGLKLWDVPLWWWIEGELREEFRKERRESLEPFKEALGKDYLTRDELIAAVIGEGKSDEAN